MISATHDQLSLLETFFVKTLKIDSKCRWDDVVGEIEIRKREDGEMTQEAAMELYKCLSEMRLTEDGAKSLR